MARKPLAPKIKRDQMVSLRLSPKEMEAVLKMVEAEGHRSVSHLLRNRLMGTRATGVIKRIEALEKRVAQLEQSNFRDYIGDTTPAIGFGSIRDDLDT